MFLAVWRSRADHYVARHGSGVDAVSSAEEGNYRWPEAPTHEGIDLGETLTFKASGSSVSRTVRAGARFPPHKGIGPGVLQLKSTDKISNGELPKSKPSGARPPTSPMQTCPRPASRSANASSTPPTMTMRLAPLASATAAVVNARNTSMTATVPSARLAPSRRLWIAISMVSASLVRDAPVSGEIEGGLGNNKDAAKPQRGDSHHDRSNRNS
jgi:hypothetical protein